MILSSPGNQFIPANMPAQLISTSLTGSIMKCSTLCTSILLCRIFDYEVSVSKQCRLFEGDTITLGKIALSPSSYSKVGTVQLSPNLFAEHGSHCLISCYHNRYLQCGVNFTCECMPHTYWNASSSICDAQSPILGAPCQQNKSMCREDINITCLQFNQCGPLSVLSGTTIMDSNTVIVGNSTAALNFPSGIGIFGTYIDSVVIADQNNNRIVAVWDAGTVYRNISVVATELAPGQPLFWPYDVYVDVRNGLKMYVSNYGTGQVFLYSNMQSVSPPPLVAAGSGIYGGTSSADLAGPFGVQADSHHNLFVADYWDNRVMFWPANATNGSLIAGLGIESNTSMGLDYPCGIALDEQNSWLYVADSLNHRIQRYAINGTWPCNGTTVAGGNGPGSASNQLYWPSYIRLSKKTGAMYIVDSGNSRIQRWKQGATEGVTMVGDPNGNAGINATMLNNPTGIAINANETQMYVTDSNNNRVQRFQLI